MGAGTGRERVAKNAEALFCSPNGGEVVSGIAEWAENGNEISQSEEYGSIVYVECLKQLFRWYG